MRGARSESVCRNGAWYLSVDGRVRAKRFPDIAVKPIYTCFYLSKSAEHSVVPAIPVGTYC
jgi:hypothetical protein